MAKKKSPSYVVSFRVPEEVFEVYMGKLQASGLNRSAFFRDYVLENRTEVVANGKAMTVDELRERGRALEALKRNKVITSEEKRRLLYLFNAVSNNVNQLAKRANSDHLAGALTESSYEAILSELQSITSALKKVLPYVD